MILSFVNKVLYIFGVIVGTSFLVFLLINLAPGDPYVNWPPELIKEFRVDDPLLIQYLHWVGNLFTLRFGNSIDNGMPVIDLIIPKYLLTLLMVFGALFFSLLIAIPLGFLSVFKQRSRFIQIIQKAVESISSTPIFIIGFFVFFIFLSRFNRNLVLRENYGYFEEIVFYLFVFIILGIGNGTVLEFMKHIHNEINEIKAKLYMTAVKARAVSYYKHLIKSSLIPILTIVSNRFVFLLSGVVVIEYLFTIRGIGLLSIEAAKNRDYPLILGITVFTVFIVLVIKIFVEMVVHRTSPNA